jgi:hypothetical protein
MKKVSLFLGMVLATSFAMAQNKTLVDQKGNTNDALVKQIGVSNDAKAQQFGNENDASVKQTGNSNIAVADQLLGDRNKATVVQENNSNKAYLTQGMIANYDGMSTINMPASDNVGSITQVGGVRNLGELMQLGNNNNGSIATTGNDNTAHLYQGWQGAGDGPAVVGYNNIASVEQIYDGNFGGLWQYGHDNKSTLHQDGNSNSAQIAQGYIYAVGVAVVWPVQGNLSEVKQDGSANNVRAMQLGDANILKLNQIGNSNTFGGLPGTGMPTYFQQTGSNNKVAGVYRDNSDLAFDINAAAEQHDGATLKLASHQTGDYNEIGLRQGAGDVALIQQDGFNNEAVLWQNGGGQDATIMQDGNNNTANVLQW